jgi:dihydrolipoamide dehydrogenase
MSDRFDVVVMGAGPAGEVAAWRLAKAGLNVALAERELVGGECAYWACIPSKTLLRPPEVRSEATRAAGVSTPDHSWQEIAEYRDFMIRNLDDASQIEGYREAGVAVFKGEARLVGHGRLEIGGDTLETDRVIVATGSDSRVPAIPGLEEAGYWTNREATTLSELPESIIVLGGGPVGIELGQFLRRMGVSVTIVQHGERLLSREEPAVGELIADTLRAEGVDLRLGSEARGVAADPNGRIVTLDDGSELRAQELLIATGRAPRVRDLGLDLAGVAPNPKGIAIDERCRAGENVWAIGDVTGVMPFTHVGKYQARIACADILGNTARADYDAIPRVVFCDPEIAAVGLTEERAQQRGLDVVAAQIDLADAIARPWTYERDPRGTLGVLVDRQRRTLVGASAVSPLASEWIHYAALAVKTRAPLEILLDTVAQFPTYAEGYLAALERLDLERG